MRPGVVCPFPESDYDVRLSFTQGNQFRACPAFWSLSHPDDDRVAGADEMEPDESIASVSAALRRGRLGHDIAGKYIRHCRTTKIESDLDALRDIFTDVVTAAHPDTETLDDLTKFISEFGAGYSFPDDGSEWWVEEPIWLLLKNGKVRVAVVAILDYLRIKGTDAHIDDLKTTGRMPDRKRFDRTLQLPIYALGVMHKFPKVERIYAENLYPACGGTMGMTVTPDLIRKAKDFLLETGEMILAGRKRVTLGERAEDVFEARPGEACTPYTGVVCPMVHRCPYVERSDVPVVTTQAEADLLAADILNLQARLDAKMVVAKRAAAQGLKLRAGAMVGQFGVRKVWAEDTAKALTLLDEQVSDTTPYVKLNREKLEKDGLLNGLMAAGLVSYAVCGGPFKFTKEKK